jgi:hypothetical protein
VDPRVFLDEVEKRKFLTLPGLELRSLCRPVRSQSLYRLRYIFLEVNRPGREANILPLSSYVKNMLNYMPLLIFIV